MIIEILPRATRIVSDAIGEGGAPPLCCIKLDGKLIRFCYLSTERSKNAKRPYHVSQYTSYLKDGYGRFEITHVGFMREGERKLLYMSVPKWLKFSRDSMYHVGQRYLAENHPAWEEIHW